VLPLETVLCTRQQLELLQTVPTRTIYYGSTGPGVVLISPGNTVTRGDEVSDLHKKFKLDTVSANTVEMECLLMEKPSALVSGER
jgi:hypothetical protein